jgi:hypothetical protein
MKHHLRLFAQGLARGIFLALAIAFVILVPPAAVLALVAAITGDPAIVPPIGVVLYLIWCSGLAYVVVTVDFDQ